MSDNSQWKFPAITALVLGVAFLLSFSPQKAWSDNTISTITVTGACNVSVAPGIAAPTISTLTITGICNVSAAPGIAAPTISTLTITGICNVSAAPGIAAPVISTMNITVNWSQPPSTPTWISPYGLTNSASGFTLNQRPKLWFWVYDASSEAITDCQLVIADDSAFATNVSTYQPTVSASGWSPTFPTMSGTTIYYTPQSDFSQTTHYLRIRASDGTNWSNWGVKKINVRSWTWTDSSLAVGGVIRAPHIQELRTVIRDVSLFRGFDVSWTDSSITPGVTLIRKAHIDEMRTELDDPLYAVGRSTGSAIWTNFSVVAGSTPIRAVHITELRTQTAYP